MWLWIVDFQRDIYSALAEHIKAFALGSGWTTLIAFLPMGIVFGAVHALTPGHSKAILATYLTGSSTKLTRALMTAVVLSFTHVSMSVVIVLLSLPLVTIMFGSGGPGSSPILENVSRALLGLIGVWMICRSLGRGGHRHSDKSDIAFGMVAGLIPCPLTLFVMTFASVRGVPEAGLMFAVVMMIGVAMTLASVALTATLFRSAVANLISRWPQLFVVVPRTIEALCGLILVTVAILQFGTG
ncbi:HoxN/HupN/NixA family nickel/cobalt transporter [Mycoplana ramosa]|uniref:Nickel/cobalt efflux system n=1 Tax=Mycoplana ramosa TaxID=40837 RepID=A0ABW3YTX0_MYCRA